MSDDILDKSEFEETGDGVLEKGGLTHPKIIPIILRPEVVFPFQVTHLEIKDKAWKKVIDKAYEEKSVVGFLYREEELEDLPVIGRVATSAAIDKIEKTFSGSYMVKFVPVNRFFTKEYIETKPVLRAEVSYYWDKPEEDEILLPLLEKYLPLLKRAGKIADSETLSEMTIERLREDLPLYSFFFFRNNPKLTKHEELIALWMYKASLRITWLIEIMDKSLTPGVERIAKVHSRAENN